VQKNGALVVCDCHGQVIDTHSQPPPRSNAHVQSSRLDSSPWTGDAVTDSSTLVKTIILRVNGHRYRCVGGIVELVNILITVTARTRGIYIPLGQDAQEPFCC